jgi:hypothetical protein
MNNTSGDLAKIQMLQVFRAMKQVCDFMQRCTFLLSDNYTPKILESKEK